MRTLLIATVGCGILASTNGLQLPAAAISALHSNGPGFAVCEGFMGPDQVEAIRRDVHQLHQEGRFKVAGVGADSSNRVDSTVRRCEQCFLYPRVKHGGGGDQSGRSILYSLLDGIRGSLEKGTGVALDSLLTEGLYVSYPNGGFYRRHIDSYPGTPQEIREFSFLLYANPNWKESDGGCLRIHTDGGGEEPRPGTPESFVDIEPKAGTLVVFRSDVPHEVLETAAERLAIVGWFNRPPSGSTARRTLIAGLGAAVAIGGAFKLLNQH